jgi:hypothetical protein
MVEQPRSSSEEQRLDQYSKNNYYYFLLSFIITLYIDGYTSKSKNTYSQKEKGFQIRKLTSSRTNYRKQYYPYVGRRKWQQGIWMRDRKTWLQMKQKKHSLCC